LLSKLGAFRTPLRLRGLELVAESGLQLFDSLVANRSAHFLKLRLGALVGFTADSIQFRLESRRQRLDNPLGCLFVQLHVNELLGKSRELYSVDRRINYPYIR